MRLCSRYLGKYLEVYIALFYVEKLIELSKKRSIHGNKFHILNLVQKYDGLENMEKPSRALEVTLCSSTDTNLGHNHTKITLNLKKNTYGGNLAFRYLVFSNHIFSESSWPLMI